MKNLVLIALLAFATVALAQTTTYPTQSHPTQPQPSSPCTTSAPCPPPAASQPDTPAPPPSGRQGAPPETGESGTQREAPALSGHRVVGTGTTIHATLDTELSQKNSRPGSTFTATITDGIPDVSGQMLIPPGTKIRGQVAEESGRASNALSVRFTNLTLSGGMGAPITATLLNAEPAGTNPSGPQKLTVREVRGGGTIAAEGGTVDLQPGTKLQIRVDQDLNVPLPR